MSNLVNVHEHSNLVVADDWAPAFTAAIAEAVGTRRGGVFVPADGRLHGHETRAGRTVDRPSRAA
jgi:hypothetical protein